MIERARSGFAATSEPTSLERVSAAKPRDRGGRLSRAWVFGDDLDTDQIVPGRYAPFMVGQDKFQAYAFCDARPGFAKEAKPGDILVGGENFGCGSSREYAVAALVKLGIGAVVAKSFARIFFRNCINLGLPVVESADAAAIVRDGDEVTLDLAGGRLATSRGPISLRAIAPFAREILDAGGVVAYLREHGDFPAVR
jgi:methanogen homoaconitase small subunit